MSQFKIANNWACFFRRMTKQAAKRKTLDKIRQQNEKLKSRDALLAELKHHSIDKSLQSKLHSVVTSNKTARKKSIRA